MKYNFETSLVSERKQAENADAFYRDILKVSEIRRFNNDTPYDLEMQQQDVDVLLTLNGVSYKISEKFREKDYADLYVEVFSKYPHKHGWLHNGSPNAVMYFTPKAVYWITHKSLSDFCLKSLFPIISTGWFDELFKSDKFILSKQLLFNGKKQKIYLIKAQSDADDGCCWTTIGISAPFSFFVENGVKVLEIHQYS